MHRKLAGLGAGLALVLTFGIAPVATAVATCPIALPEHGDPVTLDPADFVTVIDNPYFPMAQGTRWVSKESNPKGNANSVEVTVTTRSKDITGIAATVVHDQVSHDGEVVENTFDWYAQDACGNVWYLGENTKEFENGQVVSTEGSWEHGVDGAMAGVIMPADPQVGVPYRQEYLAGEAQDEAVTLSISEQAKVPAGHFDDAILVKETTPLHPRVLEYKLYALGVGPVMAISVSGGSDVERLLSFEPG
jgi:hypothetical protein